MRLTTAASLWPGGVVPYEFAADATDEERAWVLEAIRQWNSLTVIQLVPRTGQREYARFVRKYGGHTCRSSLGRSSPALVWTLDCDPGASVHEIGHLIGLWHEHQRSDAEEYAMWEEPVGDTRDLARRGSWYYPTDSRGEGPFDLLSAMSYGVAETIPPGMVTYPISPFRFEAMERQDAYLSAGDVAGVNRLYGEPSKATLVTTNPPGLEIVVDGRRMATPATFFWPAGSSHVLEAPLWQSPRWNEVWRLSTELRFVFGRWSDGGERVHEFTAGPAATWVEARFMWQWGDNRGGFGSSGPGRGPDEVQYEDNFEGFDATPRALSFIAEPGSEPAAQVVRLTNRADESRRFAVATDSRWLVADRSEASLGPGESVDIEVSALPAGLPAERYSGELRIRPYDLDTAQLQEVPGMPVAFAVLPEMVPVRLGGTGESVAVAVSGTEGFLGADGGPLAKDGRFVSANGDTYVLSKVPSGVAATLELQSQTLDLPDGGAVTLTQSGQGDWRIGQDRVYSGHRYDAGEQEYILELAGGRWRVAPYTVRMVAGPSPGPDGVPAVESALDGPTGVAVDAAGNLYVADSRNHTVRKIDAAGTITTLAGTAVRGYHGDGGPATAAQLDGPGGLAVDAAGNVYVVAAGNGLVRKIDAAGTITTLAGTGTRGYAGDGGPAAEAQLNYPSGVAVDAAGNVYVADSGNHRVRKIDAAGTITTLAGTETWGYAGDGGPAAEAQLNSTRGVAVDAAGNVYVADSGNHRVRKIDAAGTITTLAGTGTRGYAGDGGPAAEAQLNYPSGVAVDAAGNVYVVDAGNDRVRKIDAAGTIGTVRLGRADDLTWENGIAADAAGNLYVTYAGRHVVWRIDTAGTGTRVAGTEAPPEEALALGWVGGLEVDAGGNLYVADTAKHRVHRIDAAGVITTIAGTGAEGYSGDGGPATAAQLSSPRDLGVDAAGNLYVADIGNRRVRRIGPDGTITTAFVPAPGSYYGWAMAVAGSLYVVNEARVRRIDATGTITTLTTLTAPQTSFFDPTMAVDSAGRVFVADLASRTVRRIDPDGTIAATARTEAGPLAIAVGGGGQVYVGGDRNHTGESRYDQSSESSYFPGTEGYVGMVHLRDGRDTVIAGAGEPWFGHGHAVTAVAADASGKVWFAQDDGRVWVLEPLSAPPQVVVKLPGGGTVRLAKREDGGGWRIGDEPVESGHRYVRGGTEYVLEQIGEQWRVVGASVPLGASGESAEVGILADGTLVHERTRHLAYGVLGRERNRYPLDGDSLLTASNFDTYRLTAGPGGLAATVAPQQQQVAVQGGGELRVAQDTDGTWRADGTEVGSDGYVFIGARGYDLERVQGRWHLSAGTRYSIRTVAGITPVAEGIVASEAILFRPSGLATDAVGNLFIADTGNRRIRKVDVAGTIRTFAGTGMRGSSGDGGPATQARLDSPGDLAIDGAGNLYFVEADRHNVRRIDASTGVIETLAGTGDQGYWGDGGPARDAVFNTIGGLAADSAGNVYVADRGNNRVRKIDAATGTVESLAGPVEGWPGSWYGAAGLAVDGAGHVYVSQRGNHRVTRIDAGTGAVESLAEIDDPTDLAVDAAGNLYVGSDDAVTKIAAVTRAREWSREFTEPQAVSVDAAGSVHVAEPGDHRVRRIDAATGTVTAFAGAQDPTGGWDGGPAASARFSGPSLIAVDAAGRLFFIDSNRVWKLDASGMVTALAGTGEVGYTGDGGPAGEAQFTSPGGLAVDTAGNVYVADTGNHRIRRIDAAGVITTVAGTGERDYSGDGGPAIEAALRSPGALAVDLAGNVYVADSGNDQVRKLDTAGTITTVAHDIRPGFDSLSDLAVDGAGNVFVTAGHAGRELYRIDAATGEVSQEREYFGSSPFLGVPSLAADAFGNVYIFHGRHSQVKLISAEGADRVIAGNGRSGFSGDADRAAEAAVSVSDMVVDPSGAIWIADEHSRRIRVLEPSP